VVSLTADASVDAIFNQDVPLENAYRVTIENLTRGQAMTAPVIATHDGRVRFFSLGGRASSAIRALAENGDNTPLLASLTGKKTVSELAARAFDALVPGSDPGGTELPSSTNVLIRTDRAHPLFSFVSQLACTNDGFSGLTLVRLPTSGAGVFFPAVYDSGTERNTEDFLDLVPGCQPLAGIASGDPGTVVSNPDLAENRRIRRHVGIAGGVDLLPEHHGWGRFPVRVTVTPIRMEGRSFRALLRGRSTVASDVDGNRTFIESQGTGTLTLSLLPAASELRLSLAVARLPDVTEARIHAGLPDENGPAVATLYGPTAPARLRAPVRGTLTESDLASPFAGDFAAFLTALRRGELYVVVATASHPEGEIRGQIAAYR
jgi:hypothetical protein